MLRGHLGSWRTANKECRATGLLPAGLEVSDGLNYKLALLSVRDADDAFQRLGIEKYQRTPFRGEARGAGVTIAMEEYYFKIVDPRELEWFPSCRRL